LLAKSIAIFTPNCWDKDGESAVRKWAGDGTRMKNGSFGISVSVAIVLKLMIKEKDPSLVTFQLVSPLISPFTKITGEKCVFDVVCRPKRP